MDEKTRIAIVGYGNVGRGVNTSIQSNPDMELAGVFTRRPDIVTCDNKRSTGMPHSSDRQTAAHYRAAVGLTNS